MDESVRQYYEIINQQQQQNNAWSAEQAQKAMDYQTQMSNTAHQREVADLKAAGLNPVLSAGTQGATTGTGHAAQAGNENITALYGLMSKAMDAQLAQAEAMKTSAKAVSGHAGSSNPVSINEDMTEEEAREVLAERLEWLEEWASSGDPGKPLPAWADILLKKTLRVSDKDLNKLKESIGVPALCAMAAGASGLGIYKFVKKFKGRGNGNGKGGSSGSGTPSSDVGDVAGRNVREVGESEKKLTPKQQKEKQGLTKKQKQEAATAVGLAMAAVLGKGLSGGSSKQLRTLVDNAFNKA